MNTMIEIIPLTGIKIGNNLLHLSDSKEKANLIVGTPTSKWENSYFYFEDELRIYFDEQGFIEFIEFLAGIDGKLQPQIYGVNAFQEKADALYALLNSKNAGDIDDTENGYSYGFLNISVGIYRQSIPEDVQEMIKDAKEEGAPMTAENIAYERKLADHWATIGIGRKDYYQ